MAGPPQPLPMEQDPAAFSVGVSPLPGTEPMVRILGQSQMAIERQWLFANYWPFILTCINIYFLLLLHNQSISQPVRDRLESETRSPRARLHCFSATAGDTVIKPCMPMPINVSLKPPQGSTEYAPSTALRLLQVSLLAYAQLCSKAATLLHFQDVACLEQEQVNKVYRDKSLGT